MSGVVLRKNDCCSELWKSVSSSQGTGLYLRFNSSRQFHQITIHRLMGRHWLIWNGNGEPRPLEVCTWVSRSLSRPVVVVLDSTVPEFDNLWQLEYKHAIEVCKQARVFLHGQYWLHLVSEPHLFHKETLISSSALRCTYYLHGYISQQTVLLQSWYCSAQTCTYHTARVGSVSNMLPTVSMQLWFVAPLSPLLSRYEYFE